MNDTPNDVKRQKEHTLPALLDYAFEQSPHGMILLDSKGACLKINGAFKNLFGFVSENETLKEYNILEDPGFDDRTNEALKSVYFAGKAIEREIIYKFSKSLFFINKSEVFTQWYRFFCYPVIIDEQICAAVAIFIDINLKKASEANIIQRTKELRILNDIILVANNAKSPELLYRELADQIIFNLSFDTVAFYDYDPKSQKSLLQFASRNDAQFLKAFSELDCKVSPYKEIFELKNSVFFEDFSLVSSQLSRRVNIKGLALVPMTAKGEIVGALLVLSLKKHRFSAIEKKVISSIGQETGAAICRFNTDSSLNAKEDRHRKYFDNAAFGVVHISEYGRIFNLNSTFAAMLGFSETGSLLARLAHGYEIFSEEKEKALFIEILSEPAGDLVKFDARLVKSDETNLDARLILKRKLFFDKDTSYYEVFVEDASEKMEIEKAMANRIAELEKQIKELLKTDMQTNFDKD